MWLITTFVAAIVVTAMWTHAPKEYKLDFLALMLWGLAAMTLVDHVMGYNGEGPFIEADTGGLIPNGAVLGIAMLIPVFIIWEIPLVVSKVKREISLR